MLERGHVEIAHAPELDWTALPAGGWPQGPQARVLSIDPSDGALTCVLQLPAGYRRPLGHLPVASDVFVLSGSVRIGGSVRSYGWYEHRPAGATQQPWTVDEGCELLFFARTGRPDFLPEPGPGGEAAEAGVVAVDTELEPWTGSAIPGPSPGLVHKELRADEATGEGLWMVGVIPDWTYPKLEWHDVIEEIYCVQGDTWLGNAGLMTAGSYIWRPPYVTHGPFESTAGCVLLVWVNGKLVNHFVDDPATTPEENRRAAQRAAAEGA